MAYSFLLNLILYNWLTYVVNKAIIHFGRKKTQQPYTVYGEHKKRKKTFGAGWHSPSSSCALPPQNSFALVVAAAEADVNYTHHNCICSISISIQHTPDACSIHSGNRRAASPSLSLFPVTAYPLSHPPPLHIHTCVHASRECAWRGVGVRAPV